MRVDPTLRAWAKEWSSGPMTPERLEEIDQRYREEYRRKQEHEKFLKNKARVVRAAAVLGTLLGGFLFDRVCLALGMPKEWLLSNMVLRIFHSIF